jgi:hypothetical protein
MEPLEELHDKCEQADACQEGLDLIKSSASLEELYEIASAEFACWLLRNAKDLPEEIQRKAELKACEDPEYACWLRLKVQDLHPDTIEKLKEIK